MEAYHPCPGTEHRLHRRNLERREVTDELVLAEKRAISSMTGTVAWIGTETITISQESRISSFNPGLPLPAVITPTPARSRIPAMRRPIFPVPPRIPALTSSFFKDTLLHCNTEVTACVACRPEDSVTWFKSSNRDCRAVLPDEPDRLGVLEDERDMIPAVLCLNEEKRAAFYLNPAYTCL